MAVPTIPGNTYLPADIKMAVQVYWDTSLNAGSGGWAVVTGTGGAPGSGAPAATGTQTSVAGSASDVTILASNAARQGATIFNDSTALLYLLLASGTSSATNHSVQLAAGAYYEVPFNYTGIIKGIWSSATGSARVTELA